MTVVIDIKLTENCLKKQNFLSVLGIKLSKIIQIKLKNLPFSKFNALEFGK